MKTKAGISISILALALALAGCGSKGASYPTAQELDKYGPTESATASTAQSKPGEPPKVTGKVGEKPAISSPQGDPPKKLVIKDLKTGSGAAAKSGDNVTVDYVGINWSDDREFDTSFGKKPFTFQLGKGSVIKGWDQGVVGMKVGGRRVLVIPPDLGYGSSGQGSTIPPNETLVFVVDLKKIK